MHSPVNMDKAVFCVAVVVEVVREVCVRKRERASGEKEINKFRVLHNNHIDNKHVL
jgi:hypothetical protein